jgi:hypothetical protein
MKGTKKYQKVEKSKLEATKRLSDEATKVGPIPKPRHIECSRTFNWLCFVAFAHRRPSP